MTLCPRGRIILKKELGGLYMEYKPLEFPKEIFNGKEYLLGVNDNVLLRNRRLELGLTQQQVADLAMIQLRQYQRVESGERHITSGSARIMLAICAVLKIDPYEFYPWLKKIWDKK